MVMVGNHLANANTTLNECCNLLLSGLKSCNNEPYTKIAQAAQKGLLLRLHKRKPNAKLTLVSIIDRLGVAFGRWFASRCLPQILPTCSKVAIKLALHFYLVSH
ncbi:uncharacterized protein LOC129251221 [Anastrepha obliqua]|uniref:uncharacterized protein LOC129251221 n=1 Tax=Anastrepha obliqua TaxID=95512 RepID=UPI00240A2ED4|nr:uncharacterized protein LOC129251221 [Anastrepha obliqua]